MFDNASVIEQKGKLWHCYEYSASAKELIDAGISLAREGGLKTPLEEKWASAIYLKECTCPRCAFIWKAIKKAKKEYDKKEKQKWAKKAH